MGSTLEKGKKRGSDESPREEERATSLLAGSGKKKKTKRKKKGKGGSMSRSMRFAGGN